MPVETIAFPLWGWHDRDDDVLHRLLRSLRVFGQVVPLVVRTLDDGQRELVDGRWRLLLIRELGWPMATVADLGLCSESHAVSVAIALGELRLETNYVDLARAVERVRDLDPDGLSVIAATSPFSEARLQQFSTLLTFDWAQFCDERNGAQLDLITE